MPSTSVVDHIFAFGKPGNCVSSKELPLLHRVALQIVLFLRSQFRRFIVTHSEEPLLFQYSCDSTPVTVRERFSSSVSLWRAVRRGRSAKHLLAERVFVCTVKGTCKVLFGPPRTLANTQAWTHFACFRKLTDYPRVLGHTGLLHQHHVWDRAIKSACERHHHQYVLACEDLQASRMSEGQAYRLWCITFFTAVGCFLHDIHNGFKKGVAAFIENPKTMRSMWICMESARSSFNVLALFLGEWIAARLTFEPWDNMHARELWELLGFKDHWVDLLVDLELRFSRGRLRVSPRYANEERLPGIITTVMMKAWSFKTWTDSRWVSMGASSRTLLASAILGLEDLVQFILASRRASSYNIGGLAGHLSKEVLQMIGTVATSSFCMDSVLLRIMSDDRVPKQLPEIDKLISDKLWFTGALPDDVWKAIGEATGEHHGLVRDRAIASAWTSATYVENRLREARQLPWSLLQGDHSHNLDVLTDGPRPAEVNALKMWSGLRMGIPKAVYMEELQLMEKASWSANGTEQHHVCTSGMIRLHREYGLETTQSRSTCVAMRPLLSETVDERRLKSAQRALDSLKRKRPQCYTGRQHYLREIHGKAKVLQERGRDLGPHVEATIMKEHGARWRAMSERERSGYEARAAEAAAERQSELNDTKEGMVARIQALQAKVDKPSTMDSPLLISSCKLTESGLQQLETTFSSNALSKKELGEVRAEWAAVVQAPSAAEQQVLEAVELPAGVPKPPRPAWLRLLATHRSFFSSCVFRFQDGDNEHLLKYTLGVQRPHLIGFAVLTLEPAPAPCVEAVEWEREQLDTWQHRFRLSPSFVFSDSLPFPADAPAEVLTDALHIGSGIVVSDAAWKPLVEIEQCLPPVTAERATADVGEGNEQPQAEGDDRWINCPWLLDFLATGEVPSVDTTSADQLGSRREAPHAIDPEAVMDALESVRGELLDRSDVACQHFRWALHGGKWVSQQSGVAYDAFDASARGQDAKQFCAEFKLNRVASFPIWVLGEENAYILANAWCHKMQWLYDKIVAEGHEHVDFSAAALASYTEQQEFAELSQAGCARTAVRIEQIRAIAPRAR